ncbi:hypothetical protein CRG98_007563 [Punica granatum]|uniref:Uncharacterized protein n=1 Tax=Punica granatum TaxID=22663 RepID=A0A2I0KU65_PUNGR|nr:hypothetical protein CRG98_007563 [Punica granatum]
MAGSFSRRLPTAIKRKIRKRDGGLDQTKGSPAGLDPSGEKTRRGGRGPPTWLGAPPPSLDPQREVARVQPPCSRGWRGEPLAGSVPLPSPHAFQSRTGKNGKGTDLIGGSPASPRSL